MFIINKDTSQLAFLKSTAVKAFPCSRRRSTLIDVDGRADTVEDRYYIPFDPEARLNTESNIRKHSGLNGFKQSYIQEWNDITEYYLLLGVYNPHIFGGADVRRYTFAADGVGTYYVYNENDGSDAFSASFNWTYDTDSKTLTLSGRYNNGLYTVSGFNGEYLVLDSVDAKGENMREIFKRKVD